MHSERPKCMEALCNIPSSITRISELGTTPMKTYSGKPQQLQYTVMTQTKRNAEMQKNVSAWQVLCGSL